MGHIADEWHLIGPIASSALVISGIIAAIGLAIGSYLPRRAYATVAILAAFIIPFTVAGILMETADAGFARWGLLASPAIFEGFTRWFFDAPADPDSQLQEAGFHGSVYLAAGGAWLGVGVAMLVRRFRRVAA